MVLHVEDLSETVIALDCLVPAVDPRAHILLELVGNSLDTSSNCSDLACLALDRVLEISGEEGLNAEHERHNCVSEGLVMGVDELLADPVAEHSTISYYDWESSLPECV